MPLPLLCMGGGNLKEGEDSRKIRVLFSNYIDTFQNKLQEMNLSLGMFSFGKPTNYFIFIDKRFLHFIYTNQFAGSVPEVYMNDLRDQTKESFSIDELAMYMKAQRGITEYRGFSLDVKISDLPVSEQNAEIDRLVLDQIHKERNELIQQHQPLFIPIEQITRFMDIAGEDDVTNILLVPLLRHIGFKTAEAKGHRDRSLEFGQDIQRMKIQIPTGHWLFFSAQVKKGEVKANTQRQEDYVESILTQTVAQLNWEMPDAELGINIKPDHVLLIVTGNITEAAKQYIFRHRLIAEKKVLLMERENIISLCREKGLPKTVQDTIMEFNAKNTN